MQQKVYIILFRKVVHILLYYWLKRRKLDRFRRSRIQLQLYYIDTYNYFIQSNTQYTSLCLLTLNCAIGIYYLGMYPLFCLIIHNCQRVTTKMFLILFFCLLALFIVYFATTLHTRPYFGFVVSLPCKFVSTSQQYKRGLAAGYFSQSYSATKTSIILDSPQHLLWRFETFTYSKAIWKKVTETQCRFKY